MKIDFCDWDFAHREYRQCGVAARTGSKSVRDDHAIVAGIRGRNIHERQRGISLSRENIGAFAPLVGHGWRAGTEGSKGDGGALTVSGSLAHRMDKNCG